MKLIARYIEDQLGSLGYSLEDLDTAVCIMPNGAIRVWKSDTAPITILINPIDEDQFSNGSQTIS